MTFNKGDVAMDNLNVGDVVQLNSGGPDMTVKEIGGKLVTCTWFDARKKLTEDQFLLATLTKVDEPDIGQILNAVNNPD
jgi:uncharacterized protein YodC (DUF2158 family)